MNGTDTFLCETTEGDMSARARIRMNGYSQGFSDRSRFDLPRPRNLVGEWQPGFGSIPPYTQLKLRLTLAKAPFDTMPISYDEQIKKVFHKAASADGSWCMQKSREREQTELRKEICL